MSFNAIYSYYTKMAQYHTNISDIPIILVGTQDAISESNPRLIDDTRARKLASDLKRCAYYETCATYGLNVERVFQDGEWALELPEAYLILPYLQCGGLLRLHSTEAASVQPNPHPQSKQL